MIEQFKKWIKTWKPELVGIPIVLVLFVGSLFIPGAYPPGTLQMFFVGVAKLLGILTVTWIVIRHWFKNPLWKYTEVDNDPQTANFVDDFNSCNQYQRLNIWLKVFFVIGIILFVYLLKPA